MNKLAIVTQALAMNPEVIIVNVEEKNYLQTHPEYTWTHYHTMDYSVAPKNGMYEADELQEFMMGLVPGLDPSVMHRFRKWENGLMEFGKLYFDEKVGEERKITKWILTLTDEDLLNTSGFVDGKRTVDKAETRKLNRRIWVSPFPDEAFARDVINGSLPEYCKSNARESDLKKYRPNIFQRLIGKK